MAKSVFVAWVCSPNFSLSQVFTVESQRCAPHVPKPAYAHVYLYSIFSHLWFFLLFLPQMFYLHMSRQKNKRSASTMSIWYRGSCFLHWRPNKWVRNWGVLHTNVAAFDPQSVYFKSLDLVLELEQIWILLTDAAFRDSAISLPLNNCFFLSTKQ